MSVTRAASIESLGKYELLRRIACGGMAEIYLARASGIEGFEKMVVVKRILPHLADDELFVQMFLDEARLAATLDHPNVAQVYDIGVADGNYFFAMELVHGENLRTIGKSIGGGATLPIEHSLSIVKDVALALDYAHSKRSETGVPLDIVHRDVSPANIMVSYDGAVKLVDFGIARAAQRSTETKTGSLKGKVRYMSPEQCLGRQLDRRSDLFSLGAVLYEITTGIRPFDDENDMMIIRKIVEDPVAPPSAQIPGYPAMLEHIVLRMLERDPNRRYRNAEAVIIDLEAFAHDARLSMSPIGLRNFMRELFREKAASWDSARDGGVSLADHLAQTITGDSITTPAALRPETSEPSGSLQPVVIVAQPRPRRTAVAAGIGLALGIGLTLALALGGNDTEPTRAAGSQPAVEQPEPEREPVETVESKPAAAETVEPKPAAAETDPEPAETDAPADTDADHRADDEGRADKKAKPSVKRARKKSRRRSRKRPRKSTRSVDKAKTPNRTREKKWDRDSAILPE